MRFRLLLTVAAFGLLLKTAPAQTPWFEAQEIDAHVGDICYAVTASDVNGDRKTDIVAITEDAVVWYENPHWRKHDVVRQTTARDNVCIQPQDIDGDGRVDFALGAGWRPPDTRNASTLQWLGRDEKGGWKAHAISFQEPTLHRLRWGDVKGNGKNQLVVAPLQGRGTKGPNWGTGQGVRVLVYDVPLEPKQENWPVEIADSTLHTVHNLELVDIDGDHRAEILTACWEGVFVLARAASGQWTKTRLGMGNQDSQPFKGSSEIKLGRLRGGLPYLATIEPWHGHQVVVYTPPTPEPTPSGRRISMTMTTMSSSSVSAMRTGRALSAHAGPACSCSTPGPPETPWRSRDTPSTTAAWPVKMLSPQT
jgi:hypothetical protein